MRIALLLALAAPLLSALDPVPHAIYRQRRVELSSKLQRQSALLFGASTTDYHTAFRQDNDFYYLTGWTQPGAVLLILAARPALPQNPAYQRSYSEVLFLPEPTGPSGTGLVLSARTPGIPATSGFDRVESIAALPQELLRLGLRDVAEIYTHTRQPQPNATVTLAFLQQSILRPGVAQEVAPLLKSLRAVKDEFELDLIRKAAKASVAAHLAAMHSVRPGMLEYQVAALMEYEFRKLGCERPAYASIAASGANAAFDHYIANTSVLQNGELLLLDVAGEYSMYAADVTRTLPVSGQYTPRQRELYRIVRGAELAVIQAFRSGQSTLYGANSLQAVYVAYLESQGMRKFARGGVGHLLGLNVHDGGESASDYTAPLVPGSVFNIEPKIYLPDEMLGIAIEDTFYVDPNGNLVNLTGDLPVEPDDIERAMAQGRT